MGPLPKAGPFFKSMTDGVGYIPPYWIAVAYLYLNEKDNAFMWLERAHQENDPSLGGRSSQCRTPFVLTGGTSIFSEKRI